MGISSLLKTKLYLNLTQTIISNKKNILIIVPNPLLIIQLFQRFNAKYNHIGIYHNKLSNQSKYQQYLNAKNNINNIYIGTIESIFLPIDNIGLIIIDDEHHTNYIKQIYHLIDIARQRTIYHNCPLLLTSNTPSINTYTNAINDNYQLIDLKYNNNTNINIVDMNQYKNKYQQPIINNNIYKDIDKTINNNKQVLILINQRGYYPIIRCNKCNNIYKCPNCHIPLSYHKTKDTLKCHICNKNINKTISCLNCHNDSFTSFGYGIQQLENILIEKYPYINIKTIDQDTNTNKEYYNIINEYINNKIQILISDETTSNSLDINNLSLVIVLNADISLKYQNYRSSELTYNYIQQAIQRVNDHNGNIYIQVNNKDHYIIQAINNKNYIQYYNNEIKYRKSLNLPPFYNIIVIYLYSKDKQISKQALTNIIEYLTYNNIFFYKPTKNNTKINYDYYIILKYQSIKIIKTHLNIIYDNIINNYNIKINIDINPYKVKLS